MKKTFPKQFRSKKLQKGIQLIEALIAMIIVSVGLLSLMGIQMTSLNTTLRGYLDTQATSYLQQMAEVLRADPNAAKSGAYNIGSNAMISAESIASVDTGSPSAERTTSWAMIVADELPDAKVGVQCNNLGECALQIEYKNVSRRSHEQGEILTQTISVQI